MPKKKKKYERSEKYILMDVGVVEIAAIGDRVEKYERCKT